MICDSLWFLPHENAATRTNESRPRYNRDMLRCSCDLTDEAGSVNVPDRRGARKRPVNLREVANGIMQVQSTGCQWLAVSHVMILGGFCPDGSFDAISSLAACLNVTGDTVRFSTWRFSSGSIPRARKSRAGAVDAASRSAAQTRLALLAIQLVNEDPAFRAGGCDRQIQVSPIAEPTRRIQYGKAARK